MTNECLPAVIQVVREKCVNCHACIAACPVKLCNDGSGDFVSVDATTCIGCGQCLAACPHGARQAVDDLPGFLAAVGQRPMVAVVAPSVAVNYPEEYLRLNGWLRSLGVAAVFDVSFGAELYARSCVEQLRSSPQRMISPACPVVVNYLQIYEPQLLEYLAPLDTPMGHTMKMVRRFYPEFREHALVVLSPCPAKKREGAETGLGDYYLTFASLQKHLEEAGITLADFAPVAFDGPSPQQGLLSPRPGSLRGMLEESLPEVRGKVRELHGTGEVFGYLQSLPETLGRCPECVPQLIDCLNCAHGCSGGPGSLLGEATPDEIEARLAARYRAEVAGQTMDRPRFEAIVAVHWEAGSYTRGYRDRSEDHQVRLPSEEERRTILRSLHKWSAKDLYNCCSCGYGSCEQMATALFNGLSRPENCYHYLLKERGLAQQSLAEYRDHLAQIVEERTEELREANSALREEIAERRRAEKAVQDSERKLRDVVEALPIPQFAIDQDHRIIYWNKALEQLSGLSAAQMLGSRDAWRAFYREPRPCLANLLVNQTLDDLESLYPQGLRRSSLLPEAFEGGGFHSGVDGQTRWLYFTASVIRDSRGAIVGAVETLEDISVQKETERRLAESTEAAEAANRAKSEFLANMSHEIRTPMTAILGFANILHDSVKRPEDVAAVDTIVRNAEHLLSVINDILDLSKIEAGKLTVEREPCSLLAILDEVTLLMRVRAEAKNLPVEVDCEWPLPETILTDPTRLRQILINLVGNAIKFTEIGTIRLVARFVAESSPPRLEIEVRDTGIGMSDDQLAHLFQPFAQANSAANRRYGGTGLGLAISKRFAELLGGTLSVASRRHAGSTFTLAIDPGPVARVPLQWQRQAPPSSTPPAPPPPTPAELNCRVLLVEDGPDNQRLISFLLRRAGAEVLLAQNGVEALQLVETETTAGRLVDAIFMDIQMPLMDGYEAARRLRRRGYAGPIIALTAHAMTDDRQKCLDAGCDDYLTKPIDRARLLSTLAERLGARAAATDPRPFREGFNTRDS